MTHLSFCKDFMFEYTFLNRYEMRMSKDADLFYESFCLFCFDSFSAVQKLRFWQSLPCPAVEAVHLANLLCQFGYYFPVSEQKNLLVKDDSSLYRFQVKVFYPHPIMAGTDCDCCRVPTTGRPSTTLLTTSSTPSTCTSAPSGTRRSMDSSQDCR